MGYDGSIRINTKIDSKEASAQLMTLENRIVKTVDKIASLRSKMGALKDAKIPTTEYQEISAQISKAETEFNKLLEKQEQMQREGKDNGVAWDRLNAKMDEVGNTIRYAKGELQDLIDTGKAFGFGSDTEEFAKLGQQLKYAENDIAVLNKRHQELQSKNTETESSYVRLSDAVKSAFATIGKGLIDIPVAAVKKGISVLTSAFHKFGNVVSKMVVSSFKAFGNAAKKSISLITSLLKRVTSSMFSFGKSTKNTNSILGSGFKNILKYGLGIRSLYALMNKMKSVIKEGFENLYNENVRFKTSIDSLKASMLTLKNSLASAFAPIVEIAIPYIQRLVEWVTKAADAVGQLVSALMGRKTYTKAIKQSAKATEDATEATEDETKAMNKQLSPLDKLNNLTSQNEKGKTDSGVDAGAGAMFEEIPISDKWKDIAQWLKDMWENSDFYDLGKLLGEKLKNALDNIPWDKIKETARKIGKSIASFINGFIEVDGLGYSIGKTLAEAINTGFEFLNNFVHELHWNSIGRFMADTLNGFFQNIDWELIYDTFITGAKGLGDAINSFVDNLDWDAISTTISNFVNTFVTTVYTFFTTVDWTELGKRIGENLTETIKKIDFEKVGKAIGSVIQAAIDFVKNLISELSFEDIVNAITDVLKGFFEEANWEDIAKIALSLLVGALVMQSSKLKLFAVALAFLTAFQDELIALDWKKAGEIVGEYFIKFFDFLAETIENIDWYALGQKVKEFLVNIDWAGVAESFFEAIGAAFGGLAAFLGGLIAEEVVSAGEYFQGKIEECGGNVVLGILKGIGDALYDIGVWIKEHIFQPFINGFQNAFQIHSPSKVMEDMGKYIVSGLLNGLKERWKDVVSWITDKIQWLSDKISGMVGSVKSAFSGGGTFSSATSRAVQRMSSPAAYHPAIAALQNVEIPAYATGQVIPRTMRQHLAILGDNNRETEVVSPLSTMKQAFREEVASLGLMGGGNGQEINLHLTVECEGRQLLQIMQKLDSEYFKQHGKHAFA